MTQWVELDSLTHRDLRVVSDASARFGDNVGALSVLPCEYPRLLAHYPILFRKSAQTGRFEPAALLGFSNEENLFLNGERWDADYVPLQVQRQPFTLLPPTGQNAQPRIAFDADSPRLTKRDEAPTGAHALFSADGRPSEYLQRLAGILRTFASGALEALEYAQALAELELIEPVRIEVRFVDRSEVKLQGLYTIQSEALEALSEDALLALRARGFLKWAYFQQASMSQLGALVARRNRLLTGLPARCG